MNYQEKLINRVILGDEKAFEEFTSGISGKRNR